MVVLAGGDNSRMEGLRGTIYKAFLPIHGLSCIGRHVIRAAAYGIGRVDVIVDSYDPALDVLARPPLASSGVVPTPPEVRLLVHGGTPGEKIAWWHADNENQVRTLVVFGDTLAPVDLARLWDSSLVAGADSSVAVADVKLPFGVVEVTEDVVRRFLDNPRTGLLVSTGYMALGPQAVRAMRAGTDLNPTLERLAAVGSLRAVTCEGPFAAVDSLGSLAIAHDTLRDPC